MEEVFCCLLVSSYINIIQINYAIYNKSKKKFLYFALCTIGATSVLQNKLLFCAKCILANITLKHWNKIHVWKGYVDDDLKNNTDLRTSDFATDANIQLLF